MSLKAVGMQNLVTINHNGNHYSVNFAFISKKDAFTLIKNATIIDKRGNLYMKFKASIKSRINFEKSS